MKVRILRGTAVKGKKYKADKNKVHEIPDRDANMLIAFGKAERADGKTQEPQDLSTANGPGGKNKG